MWFIYCVSPGGRKVGTGCKGEGWAAHFSFRGARDICPDLCDSVSLELGYLLYACAALGTDPGLLQNPDEWRLQRPAVRTVVFAGAAGTEGPTATPPGRTQAGLGDSEGGS